MSRGWQVGWLRWSAHPLSGIECRGHTQSPAFAPGSSEGSGVFGLSVFCCPSFAQLHMHTVIFSFVVSVYPLLEERCIQVQALRPRVLGPMGMTN